MEEDVALSFGGNGAGAASVPLSDPPLHPLNAASFAAHPVAGLFPLSISLTYLLQSFMMQSGDLLLIPTFTKPIKILRQTFVWPKANENFSIYMLVLITLFSFY